MDILSENDLQAALAGLPNWQLQDNALALEHTFADFKAAWAFLSHLALLSEEHQHHAEIFNVYNRVKLRLWTHEKGGITQKDIDLARHLERALV